MTTIPEPERSTQFEIHQSDQSKALIDSINQVAKDIGAPPAFRESAWDASGNPISWQMDPTLYELLKTNHGISDLLGDL